MESCLLSLSTTTKAALPRVFAVDKLSEGSACQQTSSLFRPCRQRTELVTPHHPPQWLPLPCLKPVTRDAFRYCNVINTMCFTFIQIKVHTTTLPLRTVVGGSHPVNHPPGRLPPQIPVDGWTDERCLLSS